jgi:DNA repair exonuclease SbcCD nuclease subunit
MTTIFLGADWHIDRRIWKSRSDLEGDTYRALKRMKDAVLKHPAEHKAVILAGDIFNTRKVDGLSLLHVTEFIEELYEEDISVFFIQGNHDRDAISALEIQGAVPLHGQLVEIGNKKVYGLDWMPRTELKQAVQDAPPCDLLVLHCMFNHLVTFTNAADLDLDDVPEHVQNVLVGDVHIRDVSMLPNSGGFCCSPGSLHPCDITQDGPHGMNIWTDGFPNDRLVIKTRKIMRFVVPEEETEAEEYLEDLRDTLQAVEPSVQLDLEPIVEIKTPTRHTAKVDNIEQRFKEKFRFFVRKSATGKILSSAELAAAREEMGEINLLGGLPAFVNREEEPEVFELLEKVLMDPNATAIIQEMVEEVLK